MAQRSHGRIDLAFGAGELDYSGFARREETLIRRQVQVSQSSLHLGRPLGECQGGGKRRIAVAVKGPDNFAKKCIPLQYSAAFAQPLQPLKLLQAKWGRLATFV